MYGVDVRTRNETAGLRAAAAVSLGQGRYGRSVAEAVVATLDWLEGVTATSPWTGDEAPIPAALDRDSDDRGRLVTERLRAEDAEQLAIRQGGAGRESVYPGVVAQTIQWWLGSSVTEAPLIF